MGPGQINKWYIYTEYYTAMKINGPWSYLSAWVNEAYKVEQKSVMVEK